MLKDKLMELLRPIIKEILAEIKNNPPRLVGKKINKKPIEEAVKGINLEQPHSNLYIKGWGMDVNGNWRIVVGLPNDKGFSIQTNGRLPETNSITRHATKTLSDEELDVIGQEVTDYVSKYGSKEQKARLKRYNRQ